MYPNLLSIGPLTIHTYGLFVALGFAVAFLVMLKIGKAQGIKTQQVMDIAFIVILMAIIGSRLAYVAMNFSHYRAHPLDIFKIWEGGLVFSGGLVGVVLVMIWYLRRHRLSFWPMGDLCAPGIAIGQAIGRLGCFMAGCCYGKPTDLPWAVTFTHPQSLAPLNTPLHPTQLYAAFSGFIIFVILMFLNAKKQFQGQVFIWFLILHSTARLFMERFRGDERGLIAGTEMSMTQLLTLLVLLGAVAALFVLKSKRQK
jgi:phosphatidylglycerol:prolipoprotein diacylglycerol transferase